MEVSSCERSSIVEVVVDDILVGTSTMGTIGGFAIVHLNNMHHTITIEVLITTRGSMVRIVAISHICTIQAL
jgi:hypothetical protein